jgi:CheY-like chemotaxis protein
MAATLLLADDSVTIQRVIELTFANEDVRVVATSDGETAIQRIDAEPPDIVLADVGMPRLDGYAVAAHIKQSPALREIPVLLLTGAFEPIDEDKARASGCDGILVKPFEPQQLVGRVKELLAGTRSPARWPAALSKAPPPAPDAEPPLRQDRALTWDIEPPRFEPEQPDPAWPEPDWPPAPAPAPEAARAEPELPPPAPPSLPAPPAEVFATPASVPRSAPTSEVEETFQREFEELDAAFAELDPEPVTASLDAETASVFARDLDLYRGGGEAAPPPSRAFGDWDLPSPPQPPGLSAEQNAPSPAAPPAPRHPEPPPADPRPAQEPPGGPTAATLGPAAMPKISMAGAFAALLAAEQSLPTIAQADRSPVAISETTLEEVVRRVLARMTDDTVRRIVLETAERLIKEEIERIKTTPE